MMTKEEVKKIKTVEKPVDEKARRNSLFFWAVVVIIVNALLLVFPNMIVRIISMVVTAYALYRVVVFDNHKNRYSRKYYDRSGKPLAQPKNSKVDDLINK